MNTARLQKLETYQLMQGSHSDFEGGMCAMEFVAWLAEEPHSDAPDCACPVLAAFMRTWNDSLGDEDRNRLLKPLIPRLVGSRSTPEVEKQRSYLALDWLIREFLPTWLEQVDSLRAHAVEIRALETIRDIESAKAAGPNVRAAWVAARVAARAAAGDAARVAAWVAAWDAAWDAARGAAWVAARGAARGAIQTAVARVQISALDLVDRMLACGESSGV